MYDIFFRLNYFREIGNESKFLVGVEDLVSLRVWNYLRFIKEVLVFLFVIEICV